MEVFATYLMIKVLVFTAPIPLMTVIDFVLWIFSLLFSRFFVTYVSSTCASEAKKLNVLVENCSNFCNDETTFQKVNFYSLVELKLRSKFFFFPAKSIFIKNPSSSNFLWLRFVHNRLEANSGSSRHHRHLHDHNFPVWERFEPSTCGVESNDSLFNYF